MITQEIRRVFSFLKDTAQIEERLKTLYEEEVDKDAEDSYVRSGKNPREFLLGVLSNPEIVSEWCVWEHINPETSEWTLNDDISQRIYDVEYHVKKANRQIGSLDEEKGAQGENIKDIEGVSIEANFFQRPIHNLKQYGPQDHFSDFYKLLYSIIILHELIRQIDTYKLTWEAFKQEFKEELQFWRFGTLFEKIIKVVTKPNERTYNQLEWEAYSCLSLILRRLVGQSEINSHECSFLVLFLQLCIFIRKIVVPNKRTENTFAYVATQMALISANACYQTDYYGDGISFATIALNTNKPVDCQDAYNLLGLCAIESKQYQLAYDIYFSWINKSMVSDIQIDLGETIVTKLNKHLRSSREKTWREEEKKEVAVMYGNFAYVCSEMSDLLENTKQKYILQNLAKYHIMLAIQLDPTFEGYYCSAGTMLSSMEEVDSALEHYEKYSKLTEKPIEQLYASRRLISVYMDLFLNKENHDQNEIDRLYVIASDFVNRYKDFDAYKSRNKKIEDELVKGKNMYSLLIECESLSDEVKEAKIILLQINRLTDKILGELRRPSYLEYDFKLHIEQLTQKIRSKIKSDRTDWKETTGEGSLIKKAAPEIAYYTTLKHLQYLFAEVLPIEQDENKEDEAKNCLTMMHARYMNDPEEGLVLLQKLQDFLPSTPEILRNKLYDQKYVFLKSFTGVIDQLNMWTMYGSERMSGKDCDGCCVCIAPETFDMMVRPEERMQKDLAHRVTYEEDDFHLYNVAYMDGDNIIIDGKKDALLGKQYKQLKKLFGKLSRIIKKGSEQDRTIVSGCVVRSLEKVMFLFKDSSYFLESECRLVITRDHRDKREIRETEQTPPKLYINPFFQVYPEKIILGPKVENADEWIPHLQYELSKIREKWPSNNSRELKPVVRKSRINIR